MGCAFSKSISAPESDMAPRMSDFLHDLDPLREDLGIHVLREEARDGVRLLFLDFFSHAMGGFPLRVAGILGLPPGTAPFPGLLHLHGGSQYADPAIALAWARRGYATLCIDWSVPAGIRQAIHATRWPEGFPPAHACHVPPEDMAVGHIARAARRGLTLLQAMPEVQATRLGMIGISWGGLMSWLVNGTDDRLATVVPVYGCGYLPPDGERWPEVLEPATYAACQHGSVLHLNGTHDFFGALRTAENLMSKLRVPARRLYVPNEDHGLNEEARRCVSAWLDLHLKGDGRLPPPPDPESPGASRHVSRGGIWRRADAGPGFATVRYDGGLAFSTPVSGLDGPAPSRAWLYDAATDGLDGLFLRWDYDNLQVHQAAEAQLCLREAEGRAMLATEPALPALGAFLRVDPPRAASLPTALRVELLAPADATFTLDLYTSERVGEAHRWRHAPLSAQDALHFNLADFAPVAGEARVLDPGEIRLCKFRLESPSSGPLGLHRFGWE